MILFRAEATLASSISKFGKFFPDTDREDFNSSNESTISTSLIHNIASDGKSEQVVTWFLNRIFQCGNCTVKMWWLSGCICGWLVSSNELEPGKMCQCCACWWDKHMTAGRINRVENCADYEFVCWHPKPRIAGDQGMCRIAVPMFAGFAVQP